jgi:alkylhydroperoxidase family enzyme
MVTGAFNYANRCADALGVRQEVPVMLEAYPNLRWGVMKLLSWGIRFKTDFRNRVPRQVCADDILESLASDLKQAGLGNVPAFFEALRPRPDLLYVQSMATRAVLLETSLPRKMVLSLVYLISRLNGDVSWETDAAASLRQLGAPLESVSDLSRDDGMNGWFTRPEWEMLRFAQDITFRADETTDEQVELLRHSGLSDLLILDLVAISAAVNAMNRLNRVLACHQADQPVEKLSDSSAPSYPCSSLYSSNHAI